MRKIRTERSYPPRHSRNRRTAALPYCIFMLVMFFAGVVPVLVNVIVDPFEMNDLFDLRLEKQVISEKAHYPLWKAVHWPRKTSRVVVIGDSRARALQDRYWHELGRTDAYNFAYGGVTLHEIYDTFKYVRDNNKNLKTLVIGVQLRSFDPDHKERMNRVPEAIRLVENPLEYYSSWFVLRTGFDTVEHRYGEAFEEIASSLPRSSSAAHADTGITRFGGVSGFLPGSEICENCILPENVATQMHSSAIVLGYGRDNTDLGRWSRLWATTPMERALPPKFAKQIRVNATSDWRSFYPSENFWIWLEEISRWCRDNDVQLVFFIPPTIVEMQQAIQNFGHGEENHLFRTRLAKLGVVFDFDFDNHLTRNLDRFNDAYHFNAETSKLIIGELVHVVDPGSSVAAAAVTLARKRRRDVFCPTSAEEASFSLSDETVQV